MEATGQPQHTGKENEEVNIPKKESCTLSYEEIILADSKLAKSWQLMKEVYDLIQDPCLREMILTCRESNTQARHWLGKKLNEENK